MTGRHFKGAGGHTDAAAPGAVAASTDLGGRQLEAGDARLAVDLADGWTPMPDTRVH